MPTIVQTKDKMRAYLQAHPKAGPVPPMNRIAVWGKGAKVAAWRITGYVDKRRQSDQRTPFLVSILFPETLAQVAADIALHEVGVTEHPAGSNSGPRVHQYQEVTGAYGAPWCASFQSWCFREAAAKMHKRVQLPAVPAYVPSWTAMIRGNQRGWRRVEAIEATRGCVVTLWGSQHIEMVISREGRTLHCCGGNTSPVGQVSNGGEVAHTTRDVSEVTVAGRWVG